jgi:hypothetical protein
MPKTYEPIASTTLGTASNSVTFSAIPQTYTDLVLIVQVLSNSINDDLYLRFDGDSSAVYSHTVLRGNGTGSATSTRGSGLSRARFSDNASPTTTTSTISVINIFSYSNANVFKTMLARTNNASTGTELFADLWRSTSAVDSIEVFPASGNMASGSTFVLYGIKAA